jgi:hypothetical protein
MARKDFTGVRRRYRTSAASVGNALLYKSIEVPQAGVIRRFRVYNPDGTGTPNLTAQVWLVSQRPPCWRPTLIVSTIRS